MALVPVSISLLALWLNTAMVQPSRLGTVSMEEAPVEAAVVGITVNGEALAYTFNVALKSADTGCEQYADWWEIITPEGSLIYRRILGHSHVEEQPFTRSGGPVAINPGQTVFIRGHMNRAGYGSKVYRGSVKDGFKPAVLASDFAKSLEESEPQPSGCAF